LRACLKTTSIHTAESITSFVQPWYYNEELVMVYDGVCVRVLY